MNRKIDVLVIGAGPSGTVAAAMIKQQGFNVEIIEKERFPRFVIGESLLPRCMDILDEVGFLKAVEQQNFQKKHGATFLRNNETCNFSFSEQYTEGWKWTWQVPRAEFDQTLASAAMEQGVKIHFETEVIDFKSDNNTQYIRIKNNKEENIEARYVIDASGYGRVIPRLLNLNKASSLKTRSSIFTHIKDTNRPEIGGDRITIIDRTEGVWVWIIPFSDGTTSVGYVAEPKFIKSFEGNNTEKLHAMLKSENLIKERFDNAEFMFEPQIIDGYSIAIKQLYGNGFILTGNATEFLDPVFSSGVTFALESGLQAGKLVAKHLSGKHVDWANDYEKHIEQGVETFRTYVNAWYDNTLQSIFFAKNINTKIKSQICSVLAGYVWDKSNPYVRNHKNAISTLAKLIKQNQ